MGWKGLQAVRLESPGGEFSAAITPSTHVLGLSVRPPGQFRTAARIGSKNASSGKNSDAESC